MYCLGLENPEMMSLEEEISHLQKENSRIELELRGREEEEGEEGDRLDAAQLNFLLPLL